MCQSRYANQITATKTVPLHAAVSAMIGTEAAMVAVGFLSRIGLPHPITSRGHTFACIRPGLGGISSRYGPPSMKAPILIAYWGLGFLIVAAVALILIEARYL